MALVMAYSLRPSCRLRGEKVPMQPGVKTVVEASTFEQAVAKRQTSEAFVFTRRPGHEERVLVVGEARLNLVDGRFVQVRVQDLEAKAEKLNVFKRENNKINDEKLNITRPFRRRWPPSVS
jgi:hypothetical protein